jgi:hypothetical protein
LETSLRRGEEFVNKRIGSRGSGTRSSQATKTPISATPSTARPMMSILRPLPPDPAGLDSSEIGSLLGRPAATIRWRLSRIVGRLRKELCDA